MDSLAVRQERARKMADELEKLYPRAKTALNYSNPWELLVATILSAQCTDKLVNKVTEKLFKKYPTLDAYAKADLAEFTKDVYPVTFYQNKAKNVLAAARLVKTNFGGKVPETLAEIITLPGAARKTANVVLGNAFGKAEGFVVDTHVMRLSQKFDLTDQKDPVKIEKDMMEIVPKEKWIKFANQLILYGREYCSAKPHQCEKCPLTKIYPQAAKNWPKK